MGKLSTAQRKKLPAKDFAGPGGSYPIEDRGHAVAAKARAAEFAPPAERARIDAKANKTLGEKRSEKNDNRTADRVVARLSKPKRAK